MKKIIFTLLSCFTLVACGSQKEKNEEHSLDTGALQEIISSSLDSAVSKYATSGNVLVMDVATGHTLLDYTVEWNGEKLVVPTEPVETTMEPGALLSTMLLSSILDDPAMEMDTSMLVKAGVQFYPGPWSVQDSREPLSDSLPLRQAFADNSAVCLTELGEIFYSECRDSLSVRLLRMFPQGRAKDLKIGAPRSLRDYGILVVEGREEAAKSLKRAEYRRFYQLCQGYGIEVYPRDILSFYNTIAASDKESAKKLRDFLVAAVETGPARYIKTDSYAIAGKAATVANYDSPYLSTAAFVGFFPADSPRFSIMVTLYKSTAFGRDAAIIFRNIADKVMSEESINLVSGRNL